MAGKILVGTASWADPGFIADWYPAKLPASERLPYYAERFNLVELNSSFYAVPQRRLVRRWCEQTPSQFTMDVKLHRFLSRHSTDLKMLPPALRSLAEINENKVRVTPKLEKALTQHLLQEFGPLSECGKMGVFLLQLTPAFAPPRNNLEELDTVLELLNDHKVAVELRNRRWVTGDQLPETLVFFQKRSVTFVSVDAPQSEHFMTMPGLDAVTNPQLAYLRLHGRNATGFIRGRTVAERFDYLYSDEELETISQRALKLAEQAAETHVVYNNNSSDYALRNAATFQQMLARKVPASIALPAGSQGGTESHLGQTLEFDFTRPSPRRQPRK